MKDMKRNQGGGQGRDRRAQVPDRRPSFWFSFGSVVAALLVAGYLYAAVAAPEDTAEVPISQLAADAKVGHIAKIVVEGSAVTATYASSSPAIEPNGSPEKRAILEPGATLSETLANFGLTPEEIARIQIESKGESSDGLLIATILSSILPLAALLVVGWLVLRQVRGQGAQAFTFGQSRARLVGPEGERARVTFADVAGNREAKRELEEIVDFLKSPKKFLEIGARIPKGILLTGAPGTGKTLLARATAGEAHVAFFSISGSEFVEMFVGVGASRVRDLFKVAKAAAPSIIFIDEIDAVGRARGVGTGGGNDEREQTLNQILVEMDGFEPTETVIVMAATNRPDVLDPAILRPGRFDRRVTIDLPDRRDREEILVIQAKGKPLAEDVNMRTVAERTPGFSGADLYSLVNEAAILAAREGRKTVAQFDLIRSIEKVMLGPDRRSHLLSVAEREIVAYHEAGHAVVGTALQYADPVHKVSIVSRGRALGYTLKLPEEERRLHSRKEFLDDIAATLGGFAAEKIVFGDTTTGPSNDLQVVAAIARDMVAKYGMSEKVGPMAVQFEGTFAAMRDGEPLSDEVAHAVDAEAKRIVVEGLARAEEILNRHRPALDAVARRLLEAETVEREEYESIVVAHGVPLKPKKDIEHRGPAVGEA
jgi:cell division protease FtsH